MEDMHKTITKWIGEGVLDTPKDLESLIWALAVDGDLFDNFKKAVTDQHKKIDREMGGA